LACLCVVLTLAACASPGTNGAGTAGGAGTSSAGSGGSSGDAGASGTAGATGIAGAAGTAGVGGGAMGAAGAAGNGVAGGGGSGVAGSGGSGVAGTTGAAGAAGRGGSGGTGAAGAAGNSAAGGSGPPPGPCMAPTRYRNLFAELLSKSETDVDTKLSSGWNVLFRNGGTNTLYYEVGTDEAYILDVNNGDVRTEGLSYGMIIAVQLDKKTEFNRIWKWAKSHLQMSNGYFAWQATTSGQIIGNYSAPDGEEYFAQALISASKRWGDGTGIYAYSTEARNLLRALAQNGNFNRTNYLVTFGPSGTSASYTDGSYVLPAFYEVWACFDTANQSFWRSAVTAARAFFPKTTHATTGLAPDYANFDGTPYNGSTFRSDAYRVVMNIMMDHNLFKADPWQATWAPKYAAFFKANPDADQFQISGQPMSTGVSRSLQAANAMVAFGVPAADGKPFVQTLWDMAVPTGQTRYYDGMLYMLSFLHVSGRFQLWF
jgi:oligosaccharide reducing-end xylanase